MDLPTPTGAPLSPEDIKARQWGMIIHLSIMAGYLVPFAGFVVPVLLWQLKKHEHAQIDAHGKNVANWLLSLLVYAAVAWMMIFTLIGRGLRASRSRYRSPDWNRPTLPRRRCHRGTSA